MNVPGDFPKKGSAVSVIDAHAGGEPLRVIVDGFPPVPGNTILEKRAAIRENFDYLRRSLMWEPRGHADMYGALPVPPEQPDSDLGVIFLHNAGYSTMCGHGIIALTKVVLDTGIIRKKGDSPLLKIDTPAGTVRARAFRSGGEVVRVSFENVPSFVSQSDVQLDLPKTGKISCDLAFGGAYYAFCPAHSFPVDLTPDQAGTLIALGSAIKKKLADQVPVRHPLYPELSFLYGTIFTGPAADRSHHSRHVCIFAEGELDRSATGTGVSARAALLYFQGDLDLNREILIESIIGSHFGVKVLREASYPNLRTVIPRVTGDAFITGENKLYFNPRDPLDSGFFIR